MPDLNLLAVLGGAVLVFVLGGLWYSPALFARPWIRLMGKSEAELKGAGPSYANAIFSGKPRALWAIDSGYNLVSFVLVGILHALWH